MRIATWIPTVVLLASLAGCGGNGDVMRADPAEHSAYERAVDYLRASRRLRLDWRVRRVEGTEVSVHYRLNDLPIGTDDDAIANLRTLIPQLQPDSLISVVPYRDEDGAYPFDLHALRRYAAPYQVSVVEPQHFDDADPQL